MSFILGPYCQLVLLQIMTESMALPTCGNEEIPALHDSQSWNWSNKDAEIDQYLSEPLAFSAASPHLQSSPVPAFDFQMHQEDMQGLSPGGLFPKKDGIHFHELLWPDLNDNIELLSPDVDLPHDLMIPQDNPSLDLPPKRKANELIPQKEYTESSSHLRNKLLKKNHNTDDISKIVVQSMLNTSSSLRSCGELGENVGGLSPAKIVQNKNERPRSLAPKSSHSLSH
ncbi:uncharacterized protein PGTG_11672 [Puccinia graminis f. sp. tritici CRL 75-36-700-3]|uniref:Uncharacterized protein n=1 Tax=Puccinia graminis f. sp. tritici (strain CRL 75-36-700-3 / race SCCL) TaxID=418459 RepID=E3KNP1_PUCGT|nr:uncharacterized protein PGTG_11672 [Puccinia graminis f. sp. tritici CRL 75-36-700-3]EFP85916.2 hypothetical protein PGTG_11672 [Puccinia graminis f. sp. tritici CRL 75-36-700-3]